MQSLVIRLLFVVGGVRASTLGDELGVTVERNTYPCPLEEVVRAAVLSDRPAQLLAVIKSAHASAASTTCLAWEVFSTEKSEIERLIKQDPLLNSERHSIRITTLLDAEAILEEQGLTPVWMRPGFRKGADGTPRRTLWSLREPSNDADRKHSHPLNLLRFYLPGLPMMQHERILLLDDDVCVQHDLYELYHSDGFGQVSASDELLAPVVMASCQMQTWDPDQGGFRVRMGEYTYADTPFLGTVGGSTGYGLCVAGDDDDEAEELDPDCDPAKHASARRSCAPAALEPKLTQLHSEISGRGTFRNETAWNFGVSLIHLDRWRSIGIDGRFERWFVANEHFAFFAPNSVSFGLGLAYLALAGHVQCWPEKTVVDGLGFLSWDDLSSSGIGEVLLQVLSAIRASLVTHGRWPQRSMPSDVLFCHRLHANTLSAQMNH